jgi:hypothetical protein
VLHVPAAEGMAKQDLLVDPPEFLLTSVSQLTDKLRNMDILIKRMLTGMA